MRLQLSMRVARKICIGAASMAAYLFSALAIPAVLPDDRADIFYSKYKGGGMDITGKSILVRKKFSESLSVEANYFVDTVSGASVDVLSNASVIKDTRKQKNIEFDYIRGKTSYALSYTNSTENDYKSNTAHFSLSQDMFGDLTTVSLGFTRSWDKVGEHVGAVLFVPKGDADRRSYEAGLSQVITKNLIGAVTYELITDEGFLNNPYRQIRYFDDTVASGYSLAPEVYPRTRTSSAVSVRAKYYLWYRAAAEASYRFFRDTWGIRGNTYELGYTHPVSNQWIFEGRLRYYKQGPADFYSDIFPRADFQNFMARDKDLAGSTNTTIGGKITYAFLPDGWKMFKRGTVTLDVSHVRFDYKDFRNIKNFGIANGYPAGSEPFYKFNANIFQIYASMFF
jgi:Protein of unknown function (DUF3570)